MNQIGHIVYYSRTGNKPQRYNNLTELFNFDWISDWKVELEDIGKMDYEFQISYEDYKSKFPYALLLVSKNHFTIIGWCDDNEIIKELPIFKK